MIFDYSDRYNLKDSDISKKIFCNNARLSKEYYNTLKEKALNILPFCERFL